LIGASFSFFQEFKSDVGWCYSDCVHCCCSFGLEFLLGAFSFEVLTLR
jgi:hypothetical protein